MRGLLLPLGASILVASLGPGAAAAQEAERGVTPPERFPGYVSLFFTDPAFLERRIRPRFEVTDTQVGEQYRESILVAWSIARRLGVEVEGSFVQLDPEFGGGSSAFGGMEVAPMVSIFHDTERYLIVTARAGFSAPIGDQDDWLATHGWEWKPRLLFWKGSGTEGRNALQIEFGYDQVFDGTREQEPVLVFGAGYSHWTRSGWIPILEVTAFERWGVPDHEGATPVGTEDGSAWFTLRPTGTPIVDTDALEESDERVLAGTIGFRYALADGQQWGAGFRFPFFGDTRSFRWGLVVGGVISLQ